MDARRLDWDLLHCFLAVADSGSLSGAARQLKLSQPTVGRRMATLEAELQTRLFDRSGHALVLTAEGESLHESVRRMEAEALAASRRLSGRDVALSGSVRIACTEGIGAHWLTPALSGFQARYPEIDVELVVDNRTANLSRREADIAIRMRLPEMSAPLQTSLVGRRLGTLGIGVYASEGYLRQHGTPRAPADLMHHRIIGFDDGFGGTEFQNWLPASAQGARQSFVSNSLLAQRAAIAAGLGIGICADILVQNAPAFVRILPGLPLRQPEVWLLYHADLRQSARIRATIDFLVEAVQSTPGLLVADRGSD